MRAQLRAAALILFATGLAHSGMGELLFLRHLQAARGRRAPAGPGSNALARLFRVDTPAATASTLRTAWHTPTILGWAMALVLAYCVARSRTGGGERFVVRTIAVALALCATLWFVGSRGRHPGWVAFLASAALCWSAARMPVPQVEQGRSRE